MIPLSSSPKKSIFNSQHRPFLGGSLSRSDRMAKYNQANTDIKRVKKNSKQLFHYLILRVTRLIMANMMAIIQKRLTIRQNQTQNYPSQYQKNEAARLSWSKRIAHFPVYILWWWHVKHLAFTIKAWVYLVKSTNKSSKAYRTMRLLENCTKFLGV